MKGMPDHRDIGVSEEGSEVHENRHEAFILSNYFIICLPSIFSVVEIIIELFVDCQNIIITRARKRAG